MKSKLREFIKWNLPLAVFIAVIILSCLRASAKSENPYGTPQKIRTTVYTATGNKCANGRMPTQGLTVAFKRENIGDTIVLYECNKDGSIGALIGFYEVEDTGGSYIRSGQRIDVYRDNDTEAKKWIKQFGDFTYYQIIKSKG